MRDIALRNSYRGLVFPLFAAGIVWGFISQTHGFAAETADPIAMSKTVVILKVGSEEPLAIRTSFQERPPTIVIRFPEDQVVGSLPERSTVSKGIIQAITAHYGEAFDLGPAPKRFLRSLQIVLSAPYTYRVRSEPGRVIVEIDHTASISMAAVEVGLASGTIIGGLGESNVSERFRAMQEALASATPTPWTLQVTQELGASSQAMPRSGQPLPPGALPIERRPPQAETVVPVAKPIRTRRGVGQSSSIVWVLFLLGLGIAGVMGVWFSFRKEAIGAVLRRTRSGGMVARVPAGIVLIDQLVWRAFERQGYQLVIERELTEPPLGTLRVMMKDGSKAALSFVGHGPFFEKQTVERFSQACREANVEQGFLVAAGSFTVPAQHLAKEHHITLIGREQLIALLSAGAGSEYFTKQLEQSHARLEEAQETLRQYVNELDTLRRQRNEASWYLGEERAKSATLEARLDELQQQLQRYETDLHHWEEEASTLRKQWEESQWYLGESVARVRHLEGQLAALQEIAKRVEMTEREQEELKRHLGEERAKNEELNTRLADLQKNLEESTSRERDLQDALAQLKQEVSILRAYGDRRSHARAEIPQVVVEIRDGDEDPLFAGTPRDVSSTGVGLETDKELPALPSFRIRLSFPGQAPIESKGRLMWQQTDGQSSHYRSGCRLLGLSATTRALIEQLVWQFQST